MDERKVLLDELDQRMTEPVVNAEGALELAEIAGLLFRLGTPADVLAEVTAWRDGPGRELLDEAFAELDVQELSEGLDAILDEDATQEDVEEALWDVDDAIAAALWAGHKKAIRALAAEVAATIRQVPELFAPLAEDAKQIARLPAIAADFDVYDFWLAVVDAGQWADEDDA